MRGVCVGGGGGAPEEATVSGSGLVQPTVGAGPGDGREDPRGSADRTALIRPPTVGGQWNPDTNGPERAGY